MAGKDALERVGWHGGRWGVARSRLKAQGGGRAEGTTAGGSGGWRRRGRPGDRCTDRQVFDARAQSSSTSSLGGMQRVTLARGALAIPPIYSRQMGFFMGVKSFSQTLKILNTDHFRNKGDQLMSQQVGLSLSLSLFIWYRERKREGINGTGMGCVDHARSWQIHSTILY